MNRLDFDFHAAPARPPVLGIVLALAGLAVFVASFETWQAARAREAGLELKIAARADTRPQPAQRAAPADVAAREVQARVAAQLAYRWQPAFDALAAAQDKRIAFIALDANRTKARLKITAEARTLEHAVAWIEKLQEQPGVRRAALLQHEIQADVAEKPVRFVVDVDLAA